MNKKILSLSTVFLFTLMSNQLLAGCLSLDEEEVEKRLLGRVFHNTKQFFEVNSESFTTLKSSGFLKKRSSNILSTNDLSEEEKKELCKIRGNNSSYIVKFYKNKYEELVEDIGKLKSIVTDSNVGDLNKDEIKELNGMLNAINKVLYCIKKFDIFPK